MFMLVQASQTQMENNHWDNIDYLNTLRHSIIEAYVGIIHGLSDGGKGMSNYLICFHCDYKQPIM